MRSCSPAFSVCASAGWPTHQACTFRIQHRNIKQNPERNLHVAHPTRTSLSGISLLAYNTMRVDRRAAKAKVRLKASWIRQRRDQV